MPEDIQNEFSPGPKYPLEATPEGRAKLKDIGNRFTYHSPKGSQQERYMLLRGSARLMARSIMEETPVSREQSLALTKLEEAVMWANAAIARNE